MILSGIGKPWSIYEKISANLSSTGTPSFFLHRQKIVMVTECDSLLLFSWSGNIVDLVPMLSYANSFGIDVIGVTSNPECKLAKSSNIKIILPKVFEAGPHKLAAAYG